MKETKRTKKSGKPGKKIRKYSPPAISTTKIVQDYTKSAGTSPFGAQSC